MDTQNRSLLEDLDSRCSRLEGELRDKDRALVKFEGEVVKAEERVKEMEQVLSER
jgi:hypothetical protein